MTEYAVQIENICKYFGTLLAVDHVTLNIKKGEVFGFLGPNGSGKTTLMRIIAGLYLPDSGNGTCFGFDLVTEREKICDRMGYMTQKFGFYDDLTVNENLNFVAEIYRIKKKKEKINEILTDIGLHEKKNTFVKNLSGGWKQKVSLAAALIPSPEILLLDEPTAGVDPKSRRNFWDEIHKLATQGITILVTTHYMDEAQRCHRLNYFSSGKILRSGTVNDIIKQENLSTIELVGDNLFDLSLKIQKMFSSVQTAMFGSSLHCIASETETINNLKSFLKKDQSNQIRVNDIEPTLEHVFLKL